jgi:uncharacterized protein YukE
VELLDCLHIEKMDTIKSASSQMRDNVQEMDDVSEEETVQFPEKKRLNKGSKQLGTLAPNWSGLSFSREPSQISQISQHKKGAEPNRKQRNLTFKRS